MNPNSTPWFTLNEKVWALCYYEKELLSEKTADRPAASRAFIRMSQAFLDFWGRHVNKRTFTGWLRDRWLHYNEFTREKLRAQYVEHVRIHGVRGINSCIYEPPPPMYYGRSYPRYPRESSSPACDVSSSSSSTTPSAFCNPSLMLMSGEGASCASIVAPEPGEHGDDSLCGDVGGDFASGEGGSGFLDGESGLGGLPWHPSSGTSSSSTHEDVSVSDGSDLSFLTAGCEGWELVGCLCNSVS